MVQFALKMTSDFALKKIVHQIYFMSRGYKRFVNSVAQFSKLLADYAERF